MIVLVGINISLFFLFKNSLDIKLIGDWIYNPYYNMMGALILGFIFQLIVLISKEKALGQGDVRIAIISGLLVGSINLPYWGYITVFSALAYGLIVAYRKKKFKGLKIPFVPFMVLGNVTIILITL
jgi:prepilin signal peptidase PulO-like enzyme (type II secretory pathway)